MKVGHTAVFIKNKYGKFYILRKNLQQKSLKFTTFYRNISHNFQKERTVFFKGSILKGSGNR